MKSEIQSLEPNKIVVVGGTGAVSSTVFNALKTIAPTVVRQSGADRYATARAIVSGAWTTAATVYIATGQNFPDALSASGAAGAGKVPVVLVNGSAGSLDAATSALLTKLHATTFDIAGGTGAVSTGVASGLAKLGTVNRFSGTDRYQTSELINEGFGSPTSAYFATGTQFPDALSGAALAGANGAPLYVVQPTCVPNPIENYLAKSNTANITLIGGTGALSADVANLINCAS